jgi:SAM-dependent methyltransferase
MLDAPGMTKVRRASPGSSFELYARAMLDYWLGKRARFEFERDDGRRGASDLRGYFADAREWPRIEREALHHARGRVLDIGCGPGRHALYLQRKGFEVVGVDPSPTQRALARVRGVAQVYEGSVRRLPKGLGAFDTFLMMGNNLGLAGDLPRMGRFLRDLRKIARPRARLLGHTRIPGWWSDEHFPYVKRNVLRGRSAGQIRIRGRYKGEVGDWFDLLLLTPEELARIAAATGWDLVRVVAEDGYPRGDYIGILERR